MIAFGKMSSVACLFIAVALSNSYGALAWRQRPSKDFGVENHSPIRPTPSRFLPESTDSSPSLTEDGPLVYRYYEEGFVLDLYGLTDFLSAPDVQLLEETMTEHLNKRLQSSPVDLRVSNTQVLSQKMNAKNSMSVTSVNLRIHGQAVSTNAEAIANLSFESMVLDIFSKNPSEFKRTLKGASYGFENLLAPRMSLFESASETSHSGDKNFLVMILASVGAAGLTALVLGVCLWHQKRSSTSIDSSKMTKHIDINDELGIASTWSSSDDSSEEAPPVTPPKLRSFPTQERRNLSPCIEEGTDLDDGQDDSSEVSSHEGIYSLNNWTYSSSSSSSGNSDAETVNISLSMQSIDEFEASIRSTPPRKRRMLLSI